MQGGRQPILIGHRYQGIMKHFFVGAALLALLAGCCKKTDAPHSLCDEPTINHSTCTTDSNQVKALILGKWNWTQTISSWTQQKTNPCTDSVNRSYEFLNNGVIKYSVNGAYQSTGTYWLNTGAGLSLGAQDSASTFVLSGQVSICDNYLVVDNSPVDGPLIILVKQ